jgi:cation diffusion facilitator family transporter
LHEDGLPAADSNNPVPCEPEKNWAGAVQQRRRMSIFLAHVPKRERRAALLALLVSVVLLSAKFIAYLLTGSAAIFSDALESIVNVAAAGFAIYSLSLAHTPADREHPYGHGKIEFFAGGFEGGMILLASLFAIGKAIDAFIHGGIRDENLPIGILVLSGGLVVNAVVGLGLLRLGRRSGSVTLEADGKHLLSDAVSSVFALMAVLLVHFTHKDWIDPALAVVVAVYIAGIGIALMRHAAAGLMDRQDRDDQQLLQRILDSHIGPTGAEPHICSYHKLRHRHSGRYHWVDFHIMVPPDWHVRRGHEVASAIEYEIEQALGEGNATAHIEPCKDSGCRNCKGLAETTQGK